MDYIPKKKKNIYLQQFLIEPVDLHVKQYIVKPSNNDETNFSWHWPSRMIGRN